MVNTSYPQYPLTPSQFKIYNERIKLDFEALQPYVFPIFLFSINKIDRETGTCGKTGMIWFNTAKDMFTFINRVQPTLPKEINFSYSYAAKDRPAKANEEKIINFTWTDDGKFKEFAKYILSNNRFNQSVNIDALLDNATHQK